MLLKKYLWPQHERRTRTYVLLSLLCLVLGRVARVMTPMAYKLLTDALAAGNYTFSVLIGGVALYCGLQILYHGFNELKDILFASPMYHASRHAAGAAFAQLHRLSLKFHLERRMGSLSRTIERGIQGIENFLEYSLFRLAPIAIEVVLTCGVLLVGYHWCLSAIMLGTMIVYVAFTVIVTQWRAQFFRAKNQADAEANTRAIDSLINYETVKYFNNETLEQHRYDQSLWTYVRTCIRNRMGLSFLNFGQGAILSIGAMILLWTSGLQLARGEITIGDFVMLGAYITQLGMPLNILGFAYRELKQALVNLEEMVTLTHQEIEIADQPDAKPLTVREGTVTFENVHFSYDQERPILRDINFTIPGGKMVALVGTSGGGKSTIVKLLFRFYDATQGRITIDGQDIRAVTQTSLRAAIGIVPQDTVLFNDTIYYNIAYARPEATRAEVEYAVKVAQLESFIKSLPQGYDTIVGERGLKLSGGEKQRVAIARVILKQPSIMVFDEATSALDTQTEKEIQSSLKRISQQHTTLVIAHRLSTIVDADEILVIDHGTIVERGTHTELLAKKGVYATLSQRKET
jgi:ATP-binding cassette subfamily B protein